MEQSITASHVSINFSLLFVASCQLCGSLKLKLCLIAHTLGGGQEQRIVPGLFVTSQRATALGFKWGQTICTSWNRCEVRCELCSRQPLCSTRGPRPPPGFWWLSHRRWTVATIPQPCRPEEVKYEPFPHFFEAHRQTETRDSLLY